MLFGQWARGGSARIFCRCPNLKCQEVFIAYYDRAQAPSNNGRSIFCKYAYSRPVNFEQRLFGDPIPAVSGSFCTIYNKSSAAESQGLLQICGVGYRKALEFLIKDYLIATKSSDPNRIKSTPLGTCIANYVTEGNIKAVAERAVWLGNDETHYERKWAGKDLADLKIMIDLVVHWISVEYLTKSALESMPGT